MQHPIDNMMQTTMENIRGMVDVNTVVGTPVAGSQGTTIIPVSKVSFGIGTFCTNDTCEKALNIVIKLQYVNGRPVAKLSDAPGKAMCRDDSYLEYLRRSVAFRLQREPV